ncbi:MAG: lipopolysaccharide biosynthesis protein [Deltaproteobacteria bacterium]
MGIIARQSIKRSILQLTGSLIGVVSLLFIYPLARESYGLAQFLLSTASLFAVIFSFGSTSVVIRYFPELRQKFSSSYLSINLSLSIIVILIMTVLIGVAKDPFFSFLATLGFKTPIIDKYIYIIYILAVLFIIIQIFIFQSSNYKRVVIPYAIHELAFKIVLPILIFLSFINTINIEQIGLGLLFFYTFSLIANGLYLYKIGGFSISDSFIWDLPRKKITEVLNYMGFSGLNIIGESITTQIDRIMIPMLMTMSSNGIYSIFLFMSNTIAIPYTSMYPIASPVLSESMQKGDMKNVESIYKKTSLNSLIAGVFIFVILWVNIREIVSIMHDKDKIIPFINVFLFLSLAKLVDMVTSVNSFIIIYSKYFRYNLIFLLILALSNIVLNYYFINKYGIEGAAFATLLSVIFYNTLKLIFIQLKFKINPFSRSVYYLTAISGVMVFIAGLLPEVQWVIISIAYKSIIVTGLFYILIKIFRIDAEIIGSIEKMILNLIRKK